MNEKQQFVMELCSKAFEVSIDEICSSSRKSRVVKARHAAMKIMREQFNMHLVEIGRMFPQHGKSRDHSTVTHGIRKIDTLLEVNDPMVAPQYREVLQEVKKTIDNRQKILIYYDGLNIHDIVRRLMKEFPLLAFEIL